MKELNDITIKQAASGSKKSFKDLYYYYNPFIWKIVYRMSNGDQDNAEQIIQNIFIKVHSTLKSFKFNAAFSTWLYKIAYNESMSYLKKWNKSKKKIIEYKDTISKTRNNDQLENKDFVSFVLSKLSPEERFLLVAREVNDISFDQLSEITGKSSGSLRVTVHRIKKNIRNEYSYETGNILQKVI